MTSNNPAVLNALDTARTRWYHVQAIVIAGMGFFSDAYNLFCITTVSKLLGRLYYYDPSTGKPGKLPNNVNNAVVGVALVGTLMGQLVFGWLGNKLGRKKVYGITLILMVLCAISSGLSFGHSKKSVLGTLCFFRFWLGFGIGGDYLLSTTTMAEYANNKTSGSFIAAVFAMQGVGITAAGLVSMTLSANFLHHNPTPFFTNNPLYYTQPAGDLLWRIVLMLGALPTLLTYNWRMKMPEITRYTAIIEGDAKLAAIDMEQVWDREIEAEQDKLVQFKSLNEYPFNSGEFFRRHGLHLIVTHYYVFIYWILQLIGRMSITILLNIAFYRKNQTQKDTFPAIAFTSKAIEINAFREVLGTSRAMFVVALFCTFQGYWFTVFLIKRLGRFTIRLAGFFMMSAFMLIIGIKYDLKRDNHALFALFYGLTFPNSITVILPGELFPMRVRSTCHALSAAAGNAVAIIGAFVVVTYMLDGETKKINCAIMTLAFTNMIGFFWTFFSKGN